jgi:hypothetical protein
MQHFTKQIELKNQKNLNKKRKMCIKPDRFIKIQAH